MDFTGLCIVSVDFSNQQSVMSRLSSVHYFRIIFWNQMACCEFPVEDKFQLFKGFPIPFLFPLLKLSDCLSVLSFFLMSVFAFLSFFNSCVVFYFPVYYFGGIVMLQAVQSLSVIADDGCYIVVASHSSFYFQAVDSQIYYLIKMFV